MPHNLYHTFLFYLLFSLSLTLNIGIFISIAILSKQFSTNDFYILKIFMTSHSKKLLQKSLNRKQKKISSLTRSCSLLTFTFNIQPDKIRKSEIFTIFEKIHSLFINKLKFKESKGQIKAHFSYLAKFLFLQLQTFITFATSTPCLMKP